MEYKQCGDVVHTKTKSDVLSSHCNCNLQHSAHHLQGMSTCKGPCTAAERNSDPQSIKQLAAHRMSSMNLRQLSEKYTSKSGRASAPTASTSDGACCRATHSRNSNSRTVYRNFGIYISAAWRLPVMSFSVFHPLWKVVPRMRFQRFDRTMVRRAQSHPQYLTSLGVLRAGYLLQQCVGCVHPPGHEVRTHCLPARERRQRRLLLHAPATAPRHKQGCDKGTIISPPTDHAPTSFCKKKTNCYVGAPQNIAHFKRGETYDTPCQRRW